MLVDCHDLTCKSQTNLLIEGKKITLYMKKK